MILENAAPTRALKTQILDADLVVIGGGLAGVCCGIVMNNFVAYNVSAHGYTFAFFGMAGLHLISWALLFALLRRYTRAEKTGAAGLPTA